MGLLDWVRRAGSADATQPTEAARQKLEERLEALSRQGVEAIDAGKFFVAATAFRDALKLKPDSAALHVNLAYALMQVEQNEEARTHLEQAVRLDPASFDAHCMSGGLCETLGDVPAAIEHLKRAVALDPGFEPAHADLCRLLSGQGEHDAAHDVISAALQRHPGNLDFRLALGNVCLAQGKAGEALAHYEHVLALRGEQPALWVNKGRALVAGKQYQEARAALERALQLDPGLVAAHLELALVHRAGNDFASAEASLRRALQLAPEDAEVHNQLGGALQRQGLLEEAVAAFERSVDLAPDLPGGYVNLGLALDEMGAHGRAAGVYRKGLSLKEMGLLHQNLGIVLFKLGILDEATQHMERAIEMEPEALGNHINLAGVYGAEGRMAEAIAEYRKVLEQAPDLLIPHSNLLHYLSTEASNAEYREEARRFDAKLARSALPPPDVREPTSRRPLRIGLVSGDLRAHPVGHFIEGILSKLDTTRVELHAYPTAPRTDELTARLKPRCASWTPLQGMTDEQAAWRIREDRMDILVDLSGHTAGNRLPVFAMRPAPLQVTWLGYWASTGLSSIDYLLADEVCVPTDSEQFFSETVWRLPGTRMCFTPIIGAPDVSPLPAISNGTITFGCFQRLSKVTDAVLVAWGRIFGELPQARLLIQSPHARSSTHVQALRRRLEGVGIDAGRVRILPAVARADYLETYNEVDIVLDTFPFPGGTTTCEALWMGVPTLTVAGHSMISRQGAAMMISAGLSQWVADSEASYVRKAVALAADLQALSALRAGMRERLPKTPLFDVERFARHFEEAMLAMWREKTGVHAADAGVTS